MRTTEAARYARWAAAAAFLLAAIVVGVFAYRAWQARLVRQQAPPAVPPTVQQRSAEFSFSKVERERTLFTVRASRATEFKEGSRNLLEDVSITIYGRAGNRFDTIHTHACDYLRDTGRIVCAGEVQMDLQSAEDARQHPVPMPGGAASGRVIHVGTSQVSFDRETGEARTDRPVVFHFPYGQGRAVGVRYRSADGVVRLEKNVELTLTPAPPGAPQRAQPTETGPMAESVKLTGSSLEYRRDTRTLRLMAPVRARQGQREILAGELALELDTNLRAKRLVASRQPVLRSTEPRGQAVLEAGEFVAQFHPQGWVERILATGNVRGDCKGSAGQDHLDAQQLELEMVARRNQPGVLTATGDVRAQSHRGGVSRRLETSALRLFFDAAAKPGERRLDHAETLAPAAVEWTVLSPSGGKAVQETTRLRGQRLAAQFDARNQLRTLTGRDGVEIVRRLPDGPPQATTAREFAVQFSPGGEWTQVDEQGDVRLRDADRSAQADHAVLVRSTDTITLTGSVVLADSATRSTAQRVSFNQRTGDLRAEGGVRTTELSPGRTGVTNLAPQPANLSSDRLQANASGGRAVYSGHARLWQGDAVVQADAIELLREAQQLKARGNVAAVFPQAPSSSNASPGATPGPSRVPGQAAGPDLWRIRAGMLTYASVDARARLEQGVVAQSRQGQINSQTLELFFSPPQPAPAGPGAGAGALQLTRALASGGVTVRSGPRPDERRGTSERAEYIVAEGKFVLSGGRPTLYDAFRGTTTGRQLTFFFADDTIVVDSEEGSRTLTRHRVEK
ncbi:MAG: hypothetical protein HY237_11780 [Acidobacteria bacterium]|nr:hypothetical protein [Acidobacteriota bacterium]